MIRLILESVGMTRALARNLKAQSMTVLCPTRTDLRDSKFIYFQPNDSNISNPIAHFVSYSSC